MKFLPGDFYIQYIAVGDDPHIGRASSPSGGLHVRLDGVAGHGRSADKDAGPPEGRVSAQFLENAVPVLLLFFFHHHKFARRCNPVRRNLADFHALKILFQGNRRDDAHAGGSCEVACFRSNGTGLRGILVGNFKFTLLKIPLQVLKAPFGFYLAQRTTLGVECADLKGSAVARLEHDFPRGNLKMRRRSVASRTALGGLLGYGTVFRLSSLFSYAVEGVSRQ